MPPPWGCCVGTVIRIRIGRERLVWTVLSVRGEKCSNCGAMGVVVAGVASNTEIRVLKSSIPTVTCSDAGLASSEATSNLYTYYAGLASGGSCNVCGSP